jgi:hypothetical protein
MENLAFNLDEAELSEAWNLLGICNKRSTSDKEKAECLTKLKKMLGLTDSGTFRQTLAQAVKILESVNKERRAAEGRVVIHERNLAEGKEVVYGQRYGVISKVDTVIGKVSVRFTDGRSPKGLSLNPDLVDLREKFVARQLYFPKELDAQIHELSLKQWHSHDIEGFIARIVSDYVAERIK